MFYLKNIVRWIWFSCKTKFNVSFQHRYRYWAHKFSISLHLLLVYIVDFSFDVAFLMCADVKPPTERGEPAASEASAAASATESGSQLSSPDSVAVLKRHKAREHKRVYRCSLCNKVFQNSSNLNRHIRSHGTLDGSSSLL